MSTVAVRGTSGMLAKIAGLLGMAIGGHNGLPDLKLSTIPAAGPSRISKALRSHKSCAPLRKNGEKEMWCVVAGRWRTGLTDYRQPLFC